MIGLITSAVIKYSLLVLSLQQPMNFLKCIADSTVVKSVSEIYLEQSDLSENNQLKATSVISMKKHLRESSALKSFQNEQRSRTVQCTRAIFVEKY